MSLEMINIEPEPDRPNLEQVQSDVGGWGDTQRLFIKQMMEEG